MTNNDKCPETGLSREDMQIVIDALVKAIRSAGYCIPEQPESCDKDKCCKNMKPEDC